MLFDSYEAHGEAILRLLAQEERISAVRMTDAGRAYHKHWAQLTFAPLLHETKAPLASAASLRSSPRSTCSSGSCCATICSSAASTPKQQ